MVSKPFSVVSWPHPLILIHREKSLYLWSELPVLSTWLKSKNQTLIKIYWSLQTVQPVTLVHLHADLCISRRIAEIAWSSAALGADAEPPAISSLHQDGSWWPLLPLIFRVNWRKGPLEPPPCAFLPLTPAPAAIPALPNNLQLPRAYMYDKDRPLKCWTETQIEGHCDKFWQRFDMMGNSFLPHKLFSALFRL